MDEILIDDKKYISSKQAAKLTGYAKDYVGQLCREGRVSARLVGRSWYVLESAIQDHRFGEGAPQTEKNPQPAQKAESDINLITRPTWTAPRYEASAHEVLPTVRRDEEERKKREDEEQIRQLEIEREEERQRVREQLEYDHQIENEKKEEELRRQRQIELEQQADKEKHNTFQAPAEWPDTSVIEDIKGQQERAEDQGYSTVHIQRNTDDEISEPRYTTESSKEIGGTDRTIRVLYAIFRIAGSLIALASITIALLNTGYLDTYLASDSRASVISGIITIEK